MAVMTRRCQLHSLNEEILMSGIYPRLFPVLFFGLILLKGVVLLA